jgi:hypothetical protein
MTGDELADLADFECEMNAYALEEHLRLLAARADPDAYPSVLSGLEQADAAFTLFPPCRWWSGLDGEDEDDDA